MSGLFLNIFKLELSLPCIQIDALEYESFNTQESFKVLNEQYPQRYFYRYKDKIFTWDKQDTPDDKIEKSTVLDIDTQEYPKVFSKIFEFSFIDFLKNKLSKYRIYKNKYSGSWEIVSSQNLVQDKIEGLNVNRIIGFSPYYFFSERKLFLGFTLSTSLKNDFIWNKSEFEKNGIDICDINHKDDKIYANRQSLKRFLAARGAEETYNQIVGPENANSNRFKRIDGFYQWINKFKDQIYFPFNIKINAIQKRYLPFDGGTIKSQQLFKPQRFFYSNKTNTQGLKYYNEMVREYKPYSLEIFQNTVLNMGIICPIEYQGETEGYVNILISNIKNTFHFKNVNLSFKIKRM